jgi:amidase
VLLVVASNRTLRPVGDNSRDVFPVNVEALRLVEIAHNIHAGATICSLDATTPPVASVLPGLVVRIETTDLPYQSLTGSDLNNGTVRFAALNQLTGPIAIVGAQPGDALGFTILNIELGSVAYVPYIARWRYPTFPHQQSSVARYPIRDGVVEIADGVSIDIDPMVGCIATAPAKEILLSLSPATRTGGNLDIAAVQAGATVWLPVEVEGALFAIGDLHASMGESEPLGAGLECAGATTGVFHIVPNVQLPGPRIESATAIHFIGSHPERDEVARKTAIQAAWNWLTGECELPEDAALAVCAAELDVTLGGPAGCNYIASFHVARLRAGGIAARQLRERATTGA